MTSPTSGRWVCKRCFTANDADAVTCAQCGLQRGAQPTPAEQAQYAAASGTRAAVRGHMAQPQGWRRWLRFAWVPIAVAVAIGVAIFGGRSAGDLEVGVCYDSPREQAEVETVDDKPCTEPHQFEVFHVVEWQGSTDQYPSPEALDQFLAEQCLPAFEAYVGVSYDDSRYQIGTLVPNEDGWRSGDHEFVCSAYDPGNPQLTSSIRNSGE
jgi:Septum formation